MLLAVVILVLWSIINVINSRDITPTITNSSGDYYITSLSKPSNFQFATISCSSSNCYVICDTKTGCYQTIIETIKQFSSLSLDCNSQLSCQNASIYASKSSILTLKCNGASSCDHINLIQSSSNTTNIFCKNMSSCSYSMINISSSVHVNINCSSSYTGSNAACYKSTFDATNTNKVHVNCDQYDCYYANFYVNNIEIGYFMFNNTHSGSYANIYGSYITKSLTLFCNELYSCSNLNVHCPYYSDCNIYCNSDYSCSNTDIFIKSDIYDIDNDYLHLNCNLSSASSPKTVCSQTAFNCIGNGLSTKLQLSPINHMMECLDYKCCPFFNGNITCLPGYDCLIDCANMNDTSCVNKIINGNHATSLTVKCDDSNQCQGSSILCPYKSSCNIICNGNSYLCQYVSITANSSNYTMHLLNISCVGYGYSCYFMSLYTNNISTLNQLSINCVGNCQSSNFNLSGISVINSILINCTGKQSCYASKLIGPVNSISSMNLSCNGYQQACYQMLLQDIIISNNFNILCQSTTSCSMMNANLAVSEFSFGNIICRNPVTTSSYTNGACYKADFAIVNTMTNTMRNTNISVLCGKYDCYNTEFNFTDINVVEMDCNAQYSCWYSNFNATFVNKLQLECGNENSCSNSKIFCPFTSVDSCVIDCGNANYACNNMDIYVPNVYQYNYLYINCPSAELYTDVCKNINFICMDICPINKSDTFYTYNYTSHLYSCESSTIYDCCPWDIGIDIDQDIYFQNNYNEIVCPAKSNKNKITIYLVIGSGIGAICFCVIGIVMIRWCYTKRSTQNGELLINDDVHQTTKGFASVTDQ